MELIGVLSQIFCLITSVFLLYFHWTMSIGIPMIFFELFSFLNVQKYVIFLKAKKLKQFKKWFVWETLFELFSFLNDQKYGIFLIVKK